jgi:hypothetical protein
MAVQTPSLNSATRAGAKPIRTGIWRPLAHSRPLQPKLRGSGAGSSRITLRLRSTSLPICLLLLILRQLLPGARLVIAAALDRVSRTEDPLGRAESATQENSFFTNGASGSTTFAGTGIRF